MSAEPIHLPDDGIIAAGHEPPRPVELYLAPNRYSLDQLRASFLTTVGENTRDAYGRDLDVYLDWCDTRALDPLTVGLPEVQVYKAWLEATPSERTGQLRAPRTVARMLSAVSKFYTYVMRVGAIHYQPAAVVERPKWDRRTSKTRSVGERDARAMCALARTNAPRTWPRLCAQLTMHLLIDLGARVTEVCNINLADLGHRTDHTGATFRVVELRMKGSKVRIRPLPIQLAPLVDAWRMQRIADPDEPALLVDRDGRRITRYQIEHLVETLAQAAGIPDPHQITPHSMRHAYNMIAKARGADLEQRQHSLGHASSDTTQLYDQAVESLASDPAHLVAAATFAPTDIPGRTQT